MLSFESDYIIGAHEKVLRALVETNNECFPVTVMIFIPRTRRL